MHGNAIMTGGGLRKKDLKYNKHGKIVSKKVSAIAKKEKRLQKAGYLTKKGQFGVIMKGGASNNINNESFEYIVYNDRNPKTKLRKTNDLNNSGFKQNYIKKDIANGETVKINLPVNSIKKNNHGDYMVNINYTDHSGIVNGYIRRSYLYRKPVFISKLNSRNSKKKKVVYVNEYYIDDSKKFIYIVSDIHGKILEVNSDKLDNCRVPLVIGRKSINLIKGHFYILHSNRF
jgi:hypothetical protein